MTRQPAAYVYAVLVDGETRYIGKGTGSRSADHMRMVRSIARRRAAGETVRASLFYNKLTARWLEGAEIEILVLVEGMTDEEAYRLEAQMIAEKGGSLWNRHPGANGRTSESMRAEFADPEKKAARVKNATFCDPVKRLAANEASREALKSPKERARKSEATRKVWTDPEARQRRREAMERAWRERSANTVAGRALALVSGSPGQTRDQVVEALQEKPSTVSVALCHLKKKGLLSLSGGRYYRSEVHSIREL